MAFNLRVVLFVSFLAWLGYRYWKKTVRYRTETEFGARYGCEPMIKKNSYKWPFAIDYVKRFWDANAQGHYLALASQLFDELGPNAEQTALGATGYVTLDPDNVKAILSTNSQDYDFGARRGALLPLLGEGIFTQDGAPWKHSRELLRRQFAQIQYQNLECFAEHVENLITRLNQTDSDIVDLQPLFFQFTLDTTTALLFGKSLGTLQRDEPDGFATCFDHASLISSMRVKLGDLFWVYTPPSYKKACRAVKQYAEDYVGQALHAYKEQDQKAPPGRFAFILNLFENLRDQRLVQDQLINVLLAGRDTTATTLAWTFRLLVRHPDVLQRLREEIASTVGTEQTVSRSHIRQMPYLKAVLDETLRLYPAVPINVRTAVRSTIFPTGGGQDGSSPVLVRRGMTVAYSVYHMQRRKDIFGEDANFFRPERWENSKLADVGWAYLPFNGGPRMCLGADFALMEASYAIIRIVQSFPHICLPPGSIVEDVGAEKQKLTLILASADGCHVQLQEPSVQ